LYICNEKGQSSLKIPSYIIRLTKVIQLIPENGSDFNSNELESSSMALQSMQCRDVLLEKKKEKKDDDYMRGSKTAPLERRPTGTFS